MYQCEYDGDAKSILNEEADEELRLSAKIQIRNMEIAKEYKNTLEKMRKLVDTLENIFGRFIPGSPNLIDVLQDMKKRGIEDDRLEPVINEWEKVTILLSENPGAFEYLR